MANLHKNFIIQLKNQLEMSWQNNLQDWRVQLRRSCKLVLALNPER